tara:strand:+ start:3379 stop:3720 length:342 start_codon:yes stop_codon:yes gene_type:complete
MARTKQTARKATNEDNATPKAVASYCSVSAGASDCTDGHGVQAAGTLLDTVPRDVVEAAINNALKKFGASAGFDVHQVVALVVGELGVEETRLSMDRDAIFAYVNCQILSGQE